MPETREDLIIALRDIRRDIEEFRPSLIELYKSRYGPNCEPAILTHSLTEANEALMRLINLLRAMED